MPSSVVLPDPVWGPLAIPGWIQPLVRTPEVQRLTRIRLLNSAPRDLPALSEARRYSHTLAVTAHAESIATQQLSNHLPHDRRALVAAALLHDVATPPFGHTFEYILNSIDGWTHEGSVDSLISGTYRPEGRHAQILGGRSIGLQKQLAAAAIDEEEVTRLIQGKGPLGPLIAGSIDLDNIDNVFRMAVLLGLPVEVERGRRLLQDYAVVDGALTFSEEALELLDHWAETRARVYQVLAFDGSNLKAQAMLTEALIRAMRDGDVNLGHWSLTDESLLQLLANLPSTGEVSRRMDVGDLYRTVFTGWYALPFDRSSDLRRPDLRDSLQNALSRAIGAPACPYVFYDRGSFSKTMRLSIRSAAGTEMVERGRTSASTIVGVFSPTGARLASTRERDRVMAVLREFGLDSATLLKIPEKREVYGLPGQQVLPV